MLALVIVSDCQSPIGHHQRAKALTLLEIGHQLVHHILQSAVIADVLQGMRLMNDNIAFWTSVFLFEMLHKTGLAEGVQTLGHLRE